MKVLIKGYYGFGNLGDDILMTTMYRLLRKKFPSAQFFIFSNFSSNLQGFNRHHDYNKYILDLLDDRVQIIDWTYREDFDLVVDGGGGVYFDYSAGGATRVLLNSVSKWVGLKFLFQIDAFARWVSGRRRRLKFKKRAGYGLGIGPYTKQSKLLYQHLVEIGSTDILFVRDNTSLALLKKFRFSGVKNLSADVAFLSSHWLRSDITPRPRNEFKNRVGIILLDWHEGNATRFEVFKKFADHLIRIGVKVTFFSFDENQDIQFIKKFHSIYSLVVWRPGAISLPEFMNTLSAHDILFSARAHGAILGSILGVPSVCIATSPKLIEVSKLLSQSATVVNEPIVEEELYRQFLQMKSNYNERLASVDRDIEKNRKLADESWLEFSRHL